MLEQNARVIARHDSESVWVEVEPENSCGGCGASASCGTRLFKRSDDGRNRRFLVRHAEAIGVGEKVTIRLDERAVLRVSLIVYGIPLLAGVLAVMVAGGFGLGEVATALIFLGALVGSSWWVKTLSSRLACNPLYHPQLLCRKDGHSPGSY